MKTRGFNSIVVRLKGIVVKSKSGLNRKFQFHSGSIKRPTEFGNLDTVAVFQFHSGSIKS